MTGYRALIGCILTNLLLMIMLSSVALADSKVYQNSETGYVVRIVDDANLLSYEEEEKLVEDMKPVTKHGNAAFVSVYNYDSSTRTYAENHADGLIGSNGTLFLIDMGRREIYIYSQGAVWGKGAKTAFDVADFLNDDGTVKDLDGIKAVWKDCKFKTDDSEHLAFYCGTGWSNGNKTCK